jgi:hypothetical protein
MQRTLLTLGAVALLATATGLRADDSALLTGKWSVQKVNDDGQKITQTLEVKRDKLIFQALGENNRIMIHAEGDLRFEKFGPFKAVRFFHVRSGDSPSDLEDIDDEYLSIYTLDDDTWTLAANFDKQREQKPSLDAYQRVRVQTGRLVIDDIQMSDTPQSATYYLCFEASAPGVSRRYYVENKGYDKSQVTIPVALELTNVKPGQKCGFKLQLDDVDGDACGNEADNSSSGEFTINERGSQTYKPEEHWHYTIRWHFAP